MDWFAATIFAGITGVVVNLRYSVSRVWLDSRIITRWFVASVISAKPIARTSSSSWTRPLYSGWCSCTIDLRLYMCISTIGHSWWFRLWIIWPDQISRISLLIRWYAWARLYSLVSQWNSWLRRYSVIHWACIRWNSAIRNRYSGIWNSIRIGSQMRWLVVGR